MLVIDEAQDLSTDALEEIHMLSNVQRNGRLLIQIFLVGQINLRKRLQLPELNQLAQRIGISCHLDPLDAQQTRRYIDFRIEVAKGSKTLFTPHAVRLIYELSGGIPRIINNLCDLALVYGYGNNRKFIDHGIIESILADQIRFTISVPFNGGPDDVIPAATTKPDLQQTASHNTDNTDAGHRNEEFKGQIMLLKTTPC